MARPRVLVKKLRYCSTESFTVSGRSCGTVINSFCAFSASRGSPGGSVKSAISSMGAGCAGASVSCASSSAPARRLPGRSAASRQSGRTVSKASGRIPPGTRSPGSGSRRGPGRRVPCRHCPRENPAGPPSDRSEPARTRISMAGRASSSKRKIINGIVVQRERFADIQRGSLRRRRCRRRAHCHFGIRFAAGQ